MKYMIVLLSFVLMGSCLFSCHSNVAKYKEGNVTVFIEQGKRGSMNFLYFWE